MLGLRVAATEGLGPVPKRRCYGRDVVVGRSEISAVRPHVYAISIAGVLSDGAPANGNDCLEDAMGRVADGPITRRKRAMVISTSTTGSGMVCLVACLFSAATNGLSAMAPGKLLGDAAGLRGLPSTMQEIMEAIAATEDCQGRVRREVTRLRPNSKTMVLVAAIATGPNSLREVGRQRRARIPLRRLTS